MLSMLRIDLLPFVTAHSANGILPLCIFPSFPFPSTLGAFDALNT